MMPPITHDLGENMVKVDNAMNHLAEVESILADVMIQSAAVFSFLNVLFLLGLLWIYSNSFRKIRAEFTAGLLFFAALFLVQNLIALYSYVTMFMYFAPNVGPLVLAITAAQTVGLAALLWMSVR